MTIFLCNNIYEENMKNLVLETLALWREPNHNLEEIGTLRTFMTLRDCLT